MDEYSILADVYDILNPREEIAAQKPFFESVIKKYSVSSILDCACGTGLHLAMFHDMGIQVAGSDISADMLEIAKANLKGREIPLKQEDFRTLSRSWNMPVDMVACLTNSLPYMRTEENLDSAIGSMYDSLKNGGVLVVTNGITDSILDTKPKFIPARENYSDAFYFVCEYHEEKTMTFNVLYVAQTENGMMHKFTEITYNAMRKRVLEKAFARSKFRNVSYYGDFDFSEYSEESSTHLIVVAEK